jgi:hypothetical protein
VSIEPNTAIGPARAGDGPTRPGRLTTHEEQRQEVIRKMTTEATEQGVTEVKERVTWPEGDETVVVVSFTKEHIDGEPVYLPDRVVEYLPSGAEVPRDPDAVLRRLRAEVGEMYEKGLV